MDRFIRTRHESVASDCFVQIQDRAGDAGPGGEFELLSRSVPEQAWLRPTAVHSAAADESAW